MKTPETEKQLVEQCILFKREAQYKLYNKYKDAMYTICYRMARDHDVAADLLQEGFIQIFKSLKSFEFNSTLGTWIKTIIVRTCIRFLKENAYLMRLENVPSEYVCSASDDMTLYDLERAILNLPHGYRTVFLLIEIEGYMHKEVAEMLEISEGTSKSQLHRAKQILRSNLRTMK